MANAELAVRLGQSKAQVIEIAITPMEERNFWDEVREAFDRSAADPGDAARQKAEAELWDRVAAVDFKDECW